MRYTNYTQRLKRRRNCTRPSRRLDSGDIPPGPAAPIRLESGALAARAHNVDAMFKLAYFSFLAALIATPVHLVAGNSQTRVVVLALLLLTALFAAIGLQRRP
jgi:uncharacterized MAPEG superfamily protein